MLTHFRKENRVIIADRREEMKRVLFLLPLLILFGVSYAADPVAERPTYSAGDYWIFSADGKVIQ